MSRKVFVSHSDWDIKTPFVSYSDTKFVDELKEKSEKEVINKKRNNYFNIFVNMNYLHNIKKVKNFRLFTLNTRRKNINYNKNQREVIYSNSI